MGANQVRVVLVEALPEAEFMAVDIDDVVENLAELAVVRVDAAAGDRSRDGLLPGVEQTKPGESGPLAAELQLLGV